MIEVVRNADKAQRDCWLGRLCKIFASGNSLYFLTKWMHFSVESD